MLQNRVDPFGNIIRTTERGLVTGNRGILHNEEKEITRKYKLTAWIACALEFKGRKRVVMSPNRWTELFFLDEATSFAAGHRPCFECRRQDAVHFKSSWLRGNAEYGFNEKVPIREIDKVMQQERITGNGEKVTYNERISKLPDGTFFIFEGNPYLLIGGSMHLWTPSGYKVGIVLSKDMLVQVLTPESVVNAFRAGYVPEYHMR